MRKFGERQQQRLPGGYARSRSELCISGAGQGEPGCVVGGSGESGAVEAAVGATVATPDVWQPALSAGEVDGRHRHGIGCLNVPAVARSCDGATDPLCRCDDLVCELLVLRVCVRCTGMLDGLGGVVEAHLLPTVDGHQVLVELRGCVGGVHDLLRGAPALGRALLEQAQAVAVAVVEIAEPRFLDRRSDRDDPTLCRDVHLFADRDDDGGVGRLLCVQPTRA